MSNFVLGIVWYSPSSQFRCASWAGGLDGNPAPLACSPRIEAAPSEDVAVNPFNDGEGFRGNQANEQKPWPEAIPCIPSPGTRNLFLFVNPLTCPQSAALRLLAIAKKNPAALL